MCIARYRILFLMIITVGVTVCKCVRACVRVCVYGWVGGYCCRCLYVSAGTHIRGHDTYNMGTHKRVYTHGACNFARTHT